MEPEPGSVEQSVRVRERGEGLLEACILVDDLEEVDANWCVVLPLDITLWRLLAIPFLPERER